MKKFSTYGFSGINVKKGVAARFRKFSREISKSHSETLKTMLNFFEWNSLSPNDNLGVKTDGTKKRINALIAIVRNIEKQQTLPTKAMLDTLFQEMSQVEEEERGADLDFDPSETFTRDTELEHYRNRYEEMKQELNGYKNGMEKLMQELTYVKGTFGKGYYKLERSKEDFENFKKELENVHHYHRAENGG